MLRDGHGAVCCSNARMNTAVRFSAIGKSISSIFRADWFVMLPAVELGGLTARFATILLKFSNYMKLYY